jgi:hypothetical protein
MSSSPRGPISIAVSLTDAHAGTTFSFETHAKSEAIDRIKIPEKETLCASSCFPLAYAASIILVFQSDGVHCQIEGETGFCACAEPPDHTLLLGRHAFFAQSDRAWFRADWVAKSCICSSSTSTICAARR